MRPKTPFRRAGYSPVKSYRAAAEEEVRLWRERIASQRTAGLPTEKEEKQLADALRRQRAALLEVAIAEADDALAALREVDKADLHLGLARRLTHAEAELDRARLSLISARYYVPPKDEFERGDT